jgi:hypothetical protein
MPLALVPGSSAKWIVLVVILATVSEMTGVLAQKIPEVPVIPVFLHGLGKALPKGEAILVPCFCDVFIGEPMAWTGDRRGYMRLLDERMKKLAAEGNIPSWN